MNYFLFTCFDIYRLSFKNVACPKDNETCSKWNFYDLVTPNDRRVVIVLEGEFENESVIGEVNMLFVGVQGK